MQTTEQLIASLRRESVEAEYELTKLQAKIAKRDKAIDALKARLLYMNLAARLYRELVYTGIGVQCGTAEACNLWDLLAAGLGEMSEEGRQVPLAEIVLWTEDKLGVKPPYELTSVDDAGRDLPIMVLPPAKTLPIAKPDVDNDKVWPDAGEMGTSEDPAFGPL